MNVSSTVKVVLLSCVVAFSLTACAKKVTKTTPIPEPTIQVEEPKPEPVKVDTSNEVSFTPVDPSQEAAEKLQTIYFEFNSSSLSSSAIDRLGIIGGFLKANANLRIVIQGNCDERGSSEYNMGLGEQRSRAAKEYLVNYGVPSSQIEITSYGEERLASPNCADESCHSKNRRGEFQLLK